MLDDKSFVSILWLHPTTAVSPVNPVLGVTLSGICSPGVTASAVVLCAKLTAWLVGGRRVLLFFYRFNQKIFKINWSWFISWLCITDELSPGGSLALREEHGR